MIRRNRLTARDCVVQSFEPGSLRRVAAARLGLPLWQALGTSGGPYGHGITYRDMMTPAGLREIASYADWIGPTSPRWSRRTPCWRTPTRRA